MAWAWVPTTRDAAYATSTTDWRGIVRARTDAPSVLYQRAAWGRRLEHSYLFWGWLPCECAYVGTTTGANRKVRQELLFVGVRHGCE